jgi:hypothetical protein
MPFNILLYNGPFWKKYKLIFFNIVTPELWHSVVLHVLYHCFRRMVKDKAVPLHSTNSLGGEEV